MVGVGTAGEGGTACDVGDVWVWVGSEKNKKRRQTIYKKAEQCWRDKEKKRGRDIRGAALSREGKGRRTGGGIQPCSSLVVFGSSVDSFRIAMKAC